MLQRIKSFFRKKTPAKRNEPLEKNEAVGNTSRLFKDFNTGLAKSMAKRVDPNINVDEMTEEDVDFWSKICFAIYASMICSRNDTSKTE